MTKYAMRFAVIRFMPYIQTREFANIGVILTCPRTGYFNYQIEHRYSRLSKFFNHFNAQIYKAVTQAFADELERIKEIATHATPEQVRAMLDHIARPREAVILTGQVGATIAPNPDNELTRLFAYYVNHDFAEKQHGEAELTKTIQSLVRQVKARFPFKEELLGNPAGFHARLPLVQKENNGEIRKIIKPIYFGQKDPADIYHKSDKWIASIKRFKNQGIIKSPEILFAYQAPLQPSQAQSNALKNVLDELADNQIITVDKSQSKHILQFAAT